MSDPASIGRFVVVRRLGSGGIGTVYEAVDPEIERRVAIKLLRREMVAENPELVERLFNEARAANRIGRPGVVQGLLGQRPNSGAIPSVLSANTPSIHSRLRGPARPATA